MKLCKTEQLRENDVVAKSVLTKDYQMLLVEGTILKKDYIDKLKEFNIYEVYIQEESRLQKEEILILKKDIEETLKDKVKSIMEKHTYQHKNDLIELLITAESIIDNILEENEIIEKVFDIKERGADIYEHSISVCSFSIILAIKLKLSRMQIDDIAVGSLLHDLGLRYLTFDFENKDLGKLKDDEQQEYKKHTIYGYTALKNEKWITEKSKNIILYHHEKMDGSGFPMRIASVPLECEIVSVCDIFDEMICGIGCRRIKVHEAIEYLKIYKDVYYNKNVVETFLRFTASYPIGSLVIINSGHTAIVMRQNDNFPERPVVKIVKDEKGNPLMKEEVIDLLKNNTIFISKVI